jgi:hypothetical protein
VRKVIGPFATPDYVVLTAALPKTRSGKIMRRVLRKIIAQQTDQLGAWWGGGGAGRGARLCALLQQYWQRRLPHRTS